MTRRTTIEGSHLPWPIRLFNRAEKTWRMLTGNRPFSAVDLIETAKARCGLEDFGEGDFFEPLSRLLEACQLEANLNAIGRLGLRTDVLRNLCNRLLMQAERERDRSIAQRQIRQPLFILGLPRSGTTILHMLLASDPGHRAPRTWEVQQPARRKEENERARIRKLERDFRMLRWMAPELSRVHAMGPDLPQECVALMSASFLGDQYDSMFNIPTYREWYLRQDMRPAYDWHRRTLQHLQGATDERRWVLKAPAHMYALPTLLSTYPDALFVQTHRDPLGAVSSVSSLITLLRRLFSDVVDPRQVGLDALQYWSDSMKRFMRERAQLAPGRMVDLAYDDIRRDPIAAAQVVYRHFGWEFSPEIEAGMRETLASRPREENGLHRYEPEQFGLEAADCAQRFANYSERFDPVTATAASRVFESDAVA